MFKSNLRAGKPQIGLWLGLANAYTAESLRGSRIRLAAHRRGARAQRCARHSFATASYRALRGAPDSAAPIGETYLIKQLLDIGAQTLLIPLVETAEQAAALVEAVHYPPKGVRGVGSNLARASRWGRVPDYLPTADDQVCLLLQVETRTGLDNMEAIAATDGVDGVFIGPADLAASLGHLGNPGHPEVQEAIEHGNRPHSRSRQGAGYADGR